MGIITTLVTALNAVTATTTSEAINITGAKRITLLFTRADHSAGNTVFTVTGSIDGTNFYALNKLISNAANTNSQTVIRVASVTLSSNTTAIYALDLEYETLDSIKVTATETTDGTHTAKILIEY